MKTIGINIPLRADLYNEVILRSGDKNKDVSSLVENLLEDFLERTKDDSDLWSEEYMEKRQEEWSLEDEQHLGDPQKGYYWQHVFLPNGTHLSMVYKGHTYSARVIKQQVVYEGKVYTPSELARVIANNTSRNAWKDLRVKRPRDNQWILADDLRRQLVQ